MMRRLFVCGFLTALAICIFLPHCSAAETKILDATIDRYLAEASTWEPAIKDAATRLFWILATISMVFTFAYMIVKGNTSLGEFFGEFLRFIITTGFFYYLLENGSAIATSIIKSFGQLGLEASSNYKADLSPSNLVTFGFDLIYRALSSFGEQDIATSCIALLLSIAIAIMFGMIASMMVLLLCSAWVLVYAGIIYLGFGGGRWTSDMAVNYFKTILGIAIQTFAFCLLVGIGQSQIERLVQDSEKAKDVVVKGWVYDSTVNTTSMTIAEACIILVFTIVLFMLVKSVPQMLASVISGMSSNGINLGGGGAMAGPLGAIASGGAMMAASAAGAAMALSSAYQATQDHKENGGGLFPEKTPDGDPGGDGGSHGGSSQGGSSGGEGTGGGKTATGTAESGDGGKSGGSGSNGGASSGGGSSSSTSGGNSEGGGKAAASSKGSSGFASAMRTAGDFMLNLAGGAAGAAKEGIQKRSMLGGISANIDAKMAQTQKTREAKQAADAAERAAASMSSTSMEGADAGSQDGEDEGGGEEGGGKTDGGSGGTPPPSGTGTPGSAARGSMAMSSGKQPGQKGTSGTSAYSDATGLSSKADMDFGGSISGVAATAHESEQENDYGVFDYGKEGNDADDEWDRQIREYDPKKAGLIDET